jgi:hypothetical protein
VVVAKPKQRAASDIGAADQDQLVGWLVKQPKYSQERYAKMQVARWGCARSKKRGFRGQILHKALAGLTNFMGKEVGFGC